MRLTMRIHPLLMLLSLAACSSADEPRTSGQSGAEDTGEPAVVHHGGAIETIGISPPETPWAEMDEFEREMYMVGKVMPIMHELFAGQDAERYGQMDCQHCHGDDMREVSFAMPTPQLYRVPAPGTKAWANMERDFGPVVEFMRETVTPTMGTLLGEPDYSCGHCHQTAE
jgi:hypothetical protein